MKTEKGTLKKVNNKFLVTLPTKKGTADFQIPQLAMCFRREDAESGLEVSVERDSRNRITKVTIPGKPEIAGSPPSPPPGSRGGRESRRPGAGGPRNAGSHQGGGPAQPQAVRSTSKASPKILGMAFHNPYTFLPFNSRPPTRREPTPLSIDESPEERDRLTGVLELRVRSETPLLTCDPRHERDDNGHKTYRALTIGPDVIVPATGIRGALRSLMMLLTGGTLGYLNQHAYLCQGRDVNLGPAGPNSPPGTPAEVFLAQVIRPGSAFREGELQLGQTKLVRLDDVERCYGKKLPRDDKASPLYVGLDRDWRPVKVSSKKTPETPWRLKVSGRPINSKGKREGVFLADERRLVLPAEFWSAYSGRNAHGDHPELRKDDLVWLEPANPQATRIETADDVRSIQWARWGKRGQALREKIPSWVLPDAMQDDGLVDEVTDLFGQVPPERRFQAASFAARIRPENLVFFDSAAKVERVTLAPLAPPHPGCLAFYRNSDSPDSVSEQDDLRGYKVYRASREEGTEAPWRYDVQGVYGDQGELKHDLQKVCKTCDLVPAEFTGKLRVAFRGLTRRELALLLQTCAVPWRLGGGKPLGLGLCRVCVVGMIDELGEPMQVPGWSVTEQEDGCLDIDGWQHEVSDLQQRVEMWIASQQPVAKLRYPRAVEENNFKKSRGGHVWFKRHASPRMVTQRGGEGREPGLEPLHIDGSLKVAAMQAGEPIDARNPLIAGQILPRFDSDDPETDLLYGYDGYNTQSELHSRPRRQVYSAIEPFDPTQHVTGQERSEGSHGKDAQFRKDQKRGRRGKKG